MAPKTILDESEAEWAKDFRYATLDRSGVLKTKPLRG
jgi:hypothetical protein